MPGARGRRLRPGGPAIPASQPRLDPFGVEAQPRPLGRFVGGESLHSELVLMVVDPLATDAEKLRDLESIEETTRRCLGRLEP